MNTDTKIDWDAVAEKCRAPKGECRTCDESRDKKERHFPSHYASDHCESGKHAHCTCDICW